MAELYLLYQNTYLPVTGRHIWIGHAGGTPAIHCYLLFYEVRFIKGVVEKYITAITAR